MEFIQVSVAFRFGESGWDYTRQVKVEVIWERQYDAGYYDGKKPMGAEKYF